MIDRNDTSRNVLANKLDSGISRKIDAWIRRSSLELPSSLQIVKLFPSGLSREVGLYSLTGNKDSVKQLVIALGKGDAIVRKNYKIILSSPHSVQALFPRIYHIVTNPNGRYAEVMEYIRGCTLAEHLKKGTARTRYTLLDQVFDAITTVHKHFDSVGTGRMIAFPSARGSSHWALYHKPKLTKRIYQLTKFLPDLMETVLQSGFNIHLNSKLHFKILPLAQILECFGRQSRNCPHVPFSLIHGDFKPENIIINRKSVRFIDPHLSYGDPFVDFTKLYYWLLTDNILSEPFLTRDAKIIQWQGECVSVSKKSGAFDFHVDFTPSRQSLGLAKHFFTTISPNELSISEWGRFHLCSGVLLIWQAARLLEVGGATCLLRDGIGSKFIGNSRDAYSAIRIFRSTEPHIFELQTRHILFALFMGGFHIWRASEIFSNYNIVEKKPWCGFFGIRNES